MTDTATAPPTDLNPAEDTTTLPAGAPTPPNLELVQVDPSELIIGANVRLDPVLDRGLIGSIRDHGVRTPIVAQRDPEGRLVVLLGQRRTLAAVEAGRSLVPVVIEPAPDAAKRGETAAQVARIVDQLAENQHRTGITELEEVAAHQQLLDLGLSAGQIARRTRTPKARIQATLAIAAADAAREAMTSNGLPLDQAVVVAEFADDPLAVAELTTTGNTNPNQFGHVAQRLRDARTLAQHATELTEQLVATGITVVARPDELFGPMQRLRDLRPTPEDPEGTELTTEAHTQCPGHVAWVDELPSWRPIDERIVAVYACADWRAHGHADRYTRHTSTSRGGPMTEEQKVERRQVIANNKAWDSATTVRRTWLRTFLTRKTPPPQTAHWIARVLATSSHDLRRAMESGHYLACRLLGLTTAEEPELTWYAHGPRHLAEALTTANPTRATMITLGMLLAAFEDATSRDTWRHPNTTAQLYFTALRDWGYTLADVEHLVLTTDEDQPDSSDPDTDSGPEHDEPDTTTQDTAKSTTDESTSPPIGDSPAVVADLVA